VTTRAQVHVFACLGRFRSLADLRAYLDPMWTEDGDELDSPFMEAVGLSDYEPMCIEAVCFDHPLPLGDALAGVSYCEQWGGAVQQERLVDAVVCVFSPNRVARPEGSRLDWVGCFSYMT